MWAFLCRNVAALAHIEYSAAPHTKASFLASSGASWMLPSESWSFLFHRIELVEKGDIGPLWGRREAWLRIVWLSFWASQDYSVHEWLKETAAEFPTSPLWLFTMQTKKTCSTATQRASQLKSSSWYQRASLTLVLRGREASVLFLGLFEMLNPETLQNVIFTSVL